MQSSMTQPSAAQVSGSTEPDQQKVLSASGPGYQPDKAVAEVTGGTISPKLIADVRAWQFFEGSAKREPISIVGNRELDRYITVPDSKLPLILKLLSLFDGRHSIEWIRKYFLEQERKNVDVGNFYERISEAGLIVSPPPPRIRKGDIEAMSVKLVQFNVQPWFVFLGRLTRFFFPAGWIGSLILIGLGSWLLLSKEVILLPQVPGRGQLISFNRTDTTLYFVLIFISFFFHELAHGFVASHYKLIAKRFEAALYLGLIPMVYLRIGGLYTLPPAQRMKVWCAGIYWNLTFASVCVILLRFMHFSTSVAHVVILVALANYSIAVVNLFPFLPTDGYFLLSTLLKRHNIRRSAWREFSNWIRLRSHKLSALTLLYIVSTLTLTGIFLYRNIVWVRQGHEVASAAGIFRIAFPAIPIGILISRAIINMRLNRSKYNSDIAKEEFHA